MNEIAIFTRPESVFANLFEEQNKSNLETIKNRLETAGLLKIVPTIKITKARLPKDFLQNLQLADIIIFPSPSSIVFFFEHLQEISFDLKEIQTILLKAAIGVIGQKSQNILDILAKKPIPVITPPKGEENLHSLCRIIETKIGQNQKKSKILIPTGNLGSKNWQKLFKISPKLYEIFEKVIYENTPDISNQVQLRKQIGIRTTWIFFSPSAISALMTILDLKKADENWQAWCIGKTTAAEAEKNRFSPIHISSSAQEEILLQEYENSLQKNNLF